MADNKTILDSTKKGDLIQVNMQEVKEQVGDQIRAFLLNMMPKEVFDQVIETAWGNLTQKKKVNKGTDYSPRWEESPSELEQMVTDLLRKEMKEKITNWFEAFAKKDTGQINEVIFARLETLAMECAKQHLQSVGNEILASAIGKLNNSKICNKCGRLGHPGEYCHNCGNQIDY